jgi:hypothetical protein
VTFENATILFVKMTAYDDPIILTSLPFPFEVQISYLRTFKEFNSFTGMEHSGTGMSLSLKRSTIGQLSSGYYYPTTAFALLSMISYLINPDIVSQISI